MLGFEHESICYPLYFPHALPSYHKSNGLIGTILNHRFMSLKFEYHTYYIIT